MTRGVLSGAILLFALSGSPALAQVRGAPPVAQERDSTRIVALTGYGLMYLRFGPFFDPPSESRWVMADAAMGAGGGLEVEVGTGVWLGIDASLARTRYERRPRQGSTALASGRATVATFLLGGRLTGSGLGRLGGLSGLGRIGGLGYLNVGAGAVTYWLEDLDRASTDFLFSTAGGLEYVWGSGRSVFFELRRFWAFHEREGVENATVNHNRLDLGARTPIRQ